MTASYALWRTELKTPTVEDKRHERENKPAMLCGFWRILSARTKPDHPVAIFPQDGDSGQRIIFKIGVGAKDGQSLFSDADTERLDDFLNSTWLKCVAVSEADYHSAMNSGRWPDGKPARQFTEEQKLAHTVDLIPDTPTDEGGNDEGLPYDQQIDAKMKAEIAKHDALGKIDTQEKANAAAAILEAIQALGKLGNARRDADRQPHLTAAAAVQNLWVPILTPGSTVAQQIKDAIEAFKKAEKARLQKIADDAAEVERKRLQDIADAEAEERRKTLQAQLDAEAEQRGETAEEVVIAAEVVEVKAETVAAPRVATAFGRAVSTPKTKTATIKDAKALAIHLVEANDADLMEYLQKRANAAARAKITLPGTEIDK